MILICCVSFRSISISVWLTDQRTVSFDYLSDCLSVFESEFDCLSKFLSIIVWYLFQKLWRDNGLSWSGSLSVRLHNYQSRYSMNIRSKIEERIISSFSLIHYDDLWKAKKLLITCETKYFVEIDSVIDRWQKLSNKEKEKREYQKRKYQSRLYLISFDTMKISLGNIFLILHRKWIILLLLPIIKGCGFCDWYVSYLDSTTLDWTGLVERDWIGRHSRQDFED